MTTAREKLLTSAIYSPTNPSSEADIRGQIDGSIQEVYDIMDAEKQGVGISVNITGDQTIGGIKEFTSSPIIPNGTTTQTATTQGQLNAHKTSSDHDGRYYTEAETDALLGAKANQTTTYTKTESDNLLNAHKSSGDHDSRYYTESETDTLLSAKANQSTTYTKTESDNLINTHKSSGDHDGRYYTESEADALLGAKANQATTYTKTESDNLLNSHKSSGDHDSRYYTETETDTLLSAKANQSTTYTKTETDNLLASKATDSSVVHKTGDETVSGVKTFSNRPIVPTPINTTEAATKGYVDSTLAGAVLGAVPDDSITINKISPTIKVASYSASLASAIAQRMHTLPSDLVKAPFKTMELQGQSIQNYITNGDFANGTTGWTPAAATLSASGNIMSVTGNGTVSNVQAYQQTALVYQTSKKTYVRMKARVTNSLCSKIYFLVFSSDALTALGAYSVSTPTQDTWYDFSTIVSLANGTQGNKARVYIRAEYPDAATANGKVLQVQEAMLFDLGTSASDPLYAKTATEMKNLVPFYIEGVSDCAPQTIKVTGKNLFDKTATLSNLYSATAKQIDNGIILVAGSTTYSYFKLKRNVKPNTSYTVSFNSTRTGTTGGGIIVSDANSVQITGDANTLSNTITFNSGNNDTIYLYLYANSATGSLGDTATYTNIQLEEGSSKTSYEPYTESVMETVNLRGVPSASDIQRVDGTAEQKVGLYTLQSSDITTLNTARSNLDSINISRVAFPGIVAQSSLVAGNGDLLIPSFSPAAVTSISDLATLIGTVIDNSNVPNTLILCIPKGTYANLSAAQTALAGTEIRYELATSIMIKSPSAGRLIGLPSGNFIENTAGLKTLSPKVNYTYAMNDKAAAECEADGINTVAYSDKLKAPIDSPAFTGTVSGVTAVMVGLGNVTNESKATMFTNAALTGNPTAPTPANTDSDTSIATTALVDNKLTYETGSWSPALGDATLNTVGGYYRKVGKIIYLSGTFTVTATGTAGPVRITGLPFSINNAVTQKVAIGNGFVDLNSTATEILVRPYDATTLEFITHGNIKWQKGDIALNKSVYFQLTLTMD